MSYVLCLITDGHGCPQRGQGVCLPLEFNETIQFKKKAYKIYTYNFYI